MRWSERNRIQNLLTGFLFHLHLLLAQPSFFAIRYHADVVDLAGTPLFITSFF
jgi:hypothetical protein